MSNDKQTAVEALAEAWASIDGKDGYFQSGKNGGAGVFLYEGYIADSEELILRLAKRGYVLADNGEGQQS